jgi:hypothetical protein
MCYNQIQRAIGWAGTPWLDASGGRRHRFRAKQAKTGHSSQAETLGVSLNHKSNLVPSGSIGHPVFIVSWPLRGDGDEYTLRSGNQQPTTISHQSIYLAFLAFMDVICLLIHSSENGVGVFHLAWCNNYCAHFNFTFNHISYSTIRSADQTSCS